MIDKFAVLPGIHLYMAWILCLVLPPASLCHAAEELDCGPEGKRRTFVLEIDVEHTLTAEVLHQQVVVQEGSTFFVSTLVETTRWTFSGDVGCVVKGHLPVMLITQWKDGARSKETSHRPQLLKINDPLKRKMGLVHGHGCSVIARDPTEADQLPRSKKMEKALRGMIRDLKESADAKQDER